jgi:hypothetical protein
LEQGRITFDVVKVSAEGGDFQTGSFWIHPVTWLIVDGLSLDILVNSDIVQIHDSELF